MASRSVMNLVYQAAMKELGANVPKSKEDEVRNQVNSRVTKVLGNNWEKMPVTGPRMMVMMLVLNSVLTQYGITPGKIVETTIEKAKENELDLRFIEIMEGTKQSIKSTGEISAEKLKELMSYTEVIGSKGTAALKEMVTDGIANTKTLLSRGFKKSKNFISDIRNSDDEEETKQ